MEKLRRHKDEIRSELAKPGYIPISPHPDQRDDELKELARRVDEEGYVLLWCKVLGDLVAIYDSEADRAKIPPGFVHYTNMELRELFGDAKPDISAHALQLIHTAKAMGARVSGNYPDVPLPRLLERLQRGSEWLREQHRRLHDGVEVDQEMVTRMERLWGELEGALRVAHRYQGCVFGEDKACQEDAIIRCSTCFMS